MVPQEQLEVPPLEELVELVKVEWVEEKPEEGEVAEVGGKAVGHLQVKYFRKAQTGQVLSRQNLMGEGVEGQAHVESP